MRHDDLFYRGSVLTNLLPIEVVTKMIQAYKGAGPDIATATETNREVYDFLRDVSSRFGIRARSFICLNQMVTMHSRRYGSGILSCIDKLQQCHLRQMCIRDSLDIKSIL